MIINWNGLEKVVRQEFTAHIVREEEDENEEGIGIDLHFIFLFYSNIVWCYMTSNTYACMHTNIQHMTAYCESKIYYYKKFPDQPIPSSNRHNIQFCVIIQ